MVTWRVKTVLRTISALVIRALSQFFDDEGRDGPLKRQFLLTINPYDAADVPRKFYSIHLL
jgi:hypothetical protein